MAKADRVAVRPFGKNARVGGNVTRSTRRLKSYPPPFFFFFPPEALSCPRHRGHRTSEAERTRWARLPGRCGPVSWSFGSFFFSLQKPSLVPVTGGTVHLRPRGRDGPGFQAGVARPAGASGLFFFFSSRSLVCRCHRGRCTSEAERTRWARLPG